MGVRMKRIIDHKRSIGIILSPFLYLPLILLLWTSILLNVDASSTTTNLVSTQNSDKSNLSSNEYFPRGGGSKLSTASTSSSTDRHKSITSTPSDSLGFEDSNIPIDLINNHDTVHQDDWPIINNVPNCSGRKYLTSPRGFITDGPGFYSTNLQCIWLIDSGRNNATIRIQIHQFKTECNFDFLYVFDGDSVYSPLVAALSGDIKDFTTSLMDIKPENKISTATINLTNQLTSNSQAIPPVLSESRPFELTTYSGKAFIYFHSDTAMAMGGFHLSYSIDSCPLDCSHRGDCDYSTFKCRCNGYHGDGCQFINECPNNCTSNGSCNENKSCLCNEGFYGPDCSLRSDQQIWINLKPIPSDNETKIPARAFHQAIVVDKIMYIIGGKSRALSNSNMGTQRKKSTSTIFSFNLETKVLNDLNIIGITGNDHLADLVGFSVASKGNKIFIYGGMSMNNSILNSLSVFDTQTNSLVNVVNDRMSVEKTRSSSFDSDFSPPIAVVGHTANIIDSHMYIFFGYNPVFGYVNLVQKFNLANNTWSLSSFMDRKGSSIPGCLGHTSTYDPVDRMVYVFGGHNAHKTNNLYSFNPETEVWTFLQPGSSHRYYHTSLIVNRQLIILGGNSYGNIPHQSDKCFQQPIMTYDLSCAKNINLGAREQATTTTSSTYNSSEQHVSEISACGRKCWRSIDELEPTVLKRLGHSVVYHDNQLILYGGFNGVLLNDIKVMNLSNCEAFLNQVECDKPKLGLSCYWNSIESKCSNQLANPFNTSLTTTPEVTYTNCTRSDSRLLQHICESRETCSDCLNTNLGCVWYGLSRCGYNKGKSTSGNAIHDPESCYRDEYAKSSFVGINLSGHSMKDLQVGQDLDYVMECKRLENCYLCHSRPHCGWQNDGCGYNSPGVLSPTASSPTSSLASASASQDEMSEIGDNLGGSNGASTGGTQTISFPMSSSKMQLFPSSNSSKFMRHFDPFHRSLFASLTASLLNSSPHSCDLPCFVRGSCNECTATTKCIWCSTTEQCIDSSAYFAYSAMGQCQHYIAHMLKCPIATCVGIETCDKCLTNPRCGWLNDISNSGRGRCIEGTSAGPIFGNISTALEELQQQNSNPSSTELSAPRSTQDSFILQNWFYTSCPSCQCNGHSTCKANSSICSQPCQDFTEGQHCERCIQGYFGDPVNGGLCEPCQCNGKAHSCNTENGKCYCRTKGVIGHNCNRCDEQNHYLGDISPLGNGTCYYSLTTDFSYTFNLSRFEDTHYSDINFINVPSRKEDLDFTISCSRPALVNVTSGYSFKNRKPIHTSLECGSFRLRFPHDRHALPETNYSFFVHVYNFQTPFILQIAFSQHRTLYLPQFFFTFSSCFLFFFALSGIVWKLKHEYDIYIRRQRQFIEMEQMASRPFSTVLLEMFKKPKLGKDSELEALRQPPEPTPISFEPCFSDNVGIMSVFVQLPGRPNLAIGSALVTLNDELPHTCDDNNKRNSEKQKDQQVSV